MTFKQGMSNSGSSAHSSTSWNNSNNVSQSRIMTTGSFRDKYTIKESFLHSEVAYRALNLPHQSKFRK